MNTELLKDSMANTQRPATSVKSPKRLTFAALVSAAMLPMALASTPVLAEDMKSEDRAQAMERQTVENKSANNEAGAYPERSYTQTKRSAEEYWAEFKQDSEQTWDSSKSAFRDGWVEGKLETALILNEHLNPFEIDIEVDDATATLSGEVGSEMDKEFARNVALGIEGIDKVNNQLTVVEQAPEQAANNSGERGENDGDINFAQYISDLTTTAAIKTELLASDSISGMDVNVDTYNNTVVLSGTVQSDKERDLIESIAAKHEDVAQVVNNLRVAEQK